MGPFHAVGKDRDRGAFVRCSGLRCVFGAVPAPSMNRTTMPCSRQGWPEGGACGPILPHSDFGKDFGRYPLAERESVRRRPDFRRRHRCEVVDRALSIGTALTSVAASSATGEI